MKKIKEMGARLLKDPSTANCRVFVGHLQTDETNKLELEQHFSKYGVVIGSLINRGFGFVQFENEQSAQAAIKQEDGHVFKGRRIDVRPAKKDTHSHGDVGEKSKLQNSQSFGQKSASFPQRNNSFSGGNGGSGNVGNSNNNAGTNLNFNSQKSNFGGGNQNNNSDTPFDDKSISSNNPPPPSQEQFNLDTNKNQDEENFQQFDNSNDESSNNVNENRENTDHNDHFNSANDNQNRGQNNQFGGNSGNNGNNHNRGDDSGNSGSIGTSVGNQSGGSTGSQNNQNRLGNNQGNQNRSGNNQIRNQSNQGGNQNMNAGQSGGGGGSGGGSQSRPRGNRGGKNKNKNRSDHSGGGNNFRDRSPLNRGPRGGGNDNKVGGLRDWDHGMIPRNNNFGRDSFNDNGRFDDRFKDSPMGGMNFDRGNDYPPTVPDKNDCEIIVVNKSLTEYAEAIEGRLKKMGLTVDLLFPNEEVPLSRVLGNIANRGCLYAVVVTPNNMEHHSMTLNILHGLPQEHRNMPVEDALSLINRDFSNYKSGGRAVPFNTPFANDRHPDAIQVLLNMLADNHQLTVLQFDRILKYLEIKREEQVQTELGDTKDLGPTTIAVNDPKQAELQSRILNILNSNKPNLAAVSSQSPAQTTNPMPVPPAVWATVTTTPPTSSTTSVTPSPLLNDPTVQKALDSLLQGNLLKNIGDSTQTGPTIPQPLFAAFPNIDRF